MTTAQDNTETIRSGYEAFSKGDLDAVRKVFAPDIRWHIGGRSRLAGTYTGPDEIFGFFGKLFELTGGTFNVEIHDFLASDDHVVVLVRETGSRDGHQLDSNEVHIWHVKNGAATEYWALPQDVYATDAFWG